MNAGALLTDGENRIALSVLRSLARRGIETTVVGESAWALSFFSRYCKRKVICPSPKNDLAAFLGSVKNAIRRGDIGFLLPISDVSLMPISDHRADLTNPHVSLPLPSHESVKKAFDKSATMEAAIEEGIPIPKTFFPLSLKELKYASKKIPYPAVIKPRTSWVWKNGHALYRRPSYVNSVSELIAAYNEVHGDFSFPMIQEFVPGNNVDIAVLCDRSEPKAACAIKEYRTDPVTGGNSVYRETVEMDAKLAKYAFRLLKVLDWHGVAEVEFKIDSRDSKPKLMEVNGRFWSSVDVAVKSGIDFPYLLYRQAMGENVGPSFTYKPGVKFRWLLGDVHNLIAVLKGEPKFSKISLSSKFRTFLDFIKLYEKDINYDLLSLDDPLPFFRIG